MIQWTSRAWTDSHNDAFTRNIWTFDAGWSDNAEARAVNEFDATDQTTTWPDIDEAIRYAGVRNAYPGASSAVAAEVLQLALAASIERMAMRCHIAPPGAERVAVPAGLKLATLMQAVRWADRAQTPGGVAGAGEVGATLAASALDPDIESMIAPWLVLGLA